MPKLTKPTVAMAQVEVIFSNMRTPRCAMAAAMRKDGMRKAAIADAATFGYASNFVTCLVLRRSGQLRRHAGKTEKAYQ